MKKICSVLVLNLLIGVSLCFAVGTVREYLNYQSDVDVSTGTYRVIVSSEVPVILPEVRQCLERRILNETSSSQLRYQLGGSTTTILTAGQYLYPAERIIDDTYFGDYLFQTEAGTVDATVSLITIKKK